MSIDFRSYIIHNGRPLTDARPAAWGPNISTEQTGDATTGADGGMFWNLKHNTVTVSTMTKYGIFTPGRIPTASLPTAVSAGAGAIAYDSTINKLVVSNGTTWETVTST